MSDQHSGHPGYRRAKDVLQRVLDIAPEGRSAFLDTACAGDPPLRAEIESLLVAHDEAETTFLNSPFVPSREPSTLADGDLDFTGRRVGAYRLERLLGRGGMGAVYLASRDDGEFTKRVAIKVIRPSVATPAMLKRFRTERQILADIEHPHIARLLDGGTAEDGLPFFIMEYVEGETLAEILDRGPLPVSRALTLAAELADVLALVHSKGLVFRDLKPSNIMLTAESSAKVLDFGIAKIARGDVAELSTDHTQPGWIMGSPSYMSPEQALGERAGAPSDVFSFGVVLFEALTGRLPFDGEARRDYYRNLISADAKILPSSFPRALRELVDRCLRKEPVERYASGADLAAAVRSISKGGAGDAAATAARNPYVWFAVVSLVVLVVVLQRWMGGGQPRDPRLLGAPQPVVTWASDEVNPRVSPDLRWISFISDRDGESKLWLRERTSGEQRIITPLGGELLSHEWSPSSDHVAYITRTSTHTMLNVSELTAAARADVFEIKADTTLVRWIGDGIYYLAERSLWRFDLRTRQSREVTTARGPHRLRSVDVSADERHIVFTTLEPDFTRLWHASIDGGNAVPLTDKRIDPRFPRWKGAGSDKFVYVSEESGQVDIWLMDVSTRERTPLTISGAREAGIGVSGDGSLLLYEQIAENDVVAALDPFGKPPEIRSLTSNSLSDLAPSASASGNLVVFQRAKSENLGVGIYDATVLLNRDRFTTESETIGDGYAPEVSPDGRWVAYLVKGPSPASANLQVYDVQERNTVSISESFAKPEHSLFPLAWLEVNLVWSPVKPELYFVALGPSGHHAIVRASFPATSGSVRTESIVSIDDATAAIKDVRVSSHGDRLSYLLTSTSKSTSELHVVDLAGGPESTLVREGSAVTLTCPGWTADDSIVILHSDSHMVLVNVLMVNGAGRKANDRGGDARGQLRDVELGSVSLDTRRRILYFTRTDRAVHSLHSFSLDTREERRLYSGERHGGAFSGTRVLEDGRLLFSFQKRNSDIYCNKLGR